MGYLLGNVWSGGAVQPDAFRDALADLSAGVWSSALTGSTDFTSVRVRSGDDGYAAFYAEAGYLAAGGESPASAATFHAFSSYAWCDDRKKVVMCGGGHADDLDGGVYEFDLPTLTFSRTQASCRYARNQLKISSLTSSGTTCTATTIADHHLSVGDDVTIQWAAQSAYNGDFTVASVVDTDTFTYEALSAPSASPATTSAADGITVSPNWYYSQTEFGGDDTTAPFQSGDTFGWRAFPNADGERGPVAGHTYGSMVDLPTAGLVWWNAGAAFHQGGAGPGGGWPIDRDTGKFRPASEGWEDAPTNSTDQMCFRIIDDGGTERVFATKVTAFGFSAFLLDVPTKTSHQIVDQSTNAPSHKIGCVIPSPDNADRLAYVADAGNGTELSIVQPIDLWPPSGGALSRLSYGNTKPSSVNANATWLYSEGWGKILVFQPTIGFYTLTLDTWEWSDLLYDVTGLPAPSGDAKQWKRIFHMPAYSSAGDYETIGFLHAATAIFYAFKLPVSVVA